MAYEVVVRFSWTGKTGIQPSGNCNNYLFNIFSFDKLFIVGKTKLIFSDMNGIQSLVHTTVNLVFVCDKEQVTKAMVEFVKRGSQRFVRVSEKLNKK